MKTITNHDQIAGMPALVVRQFLSECNGLIIAADVWAWLRLNSRTPSAVFEQLIREGYLEPRARQHNPPELFKTRKARDLVHAPGVTPLTLEEAHAVLSKLLSEIEQINGSPEIAHRVVSITLKGPMVTQPVETVPYLDVEILVSPFSSAPTVQRDAEALAKEMLESRYGHKVGVEGQQHLSTRLIENRLRGVDPHVCVRIVPLDY